MGQSADSLLEAMAGHVHWDADWDESTRGAQHQAACFLNCFSLLPGFSPHFAELVPPGHFSGRVHRTSWRRAHQCRFDLTLDSLLLGILDTRSFHLRRYPSIGFRLLIHLLLARVSSLAELIMMTYFHFLFGDFLYHLFLRNTPVSQIVSRWRLCGGLPQSSASVLSLFTSLPTLDSYHIFNTFIGLTDVLPSRNFLQLNTVFFLFPLLLFLFCSRSWCSPSTIVSSLCTACFFLGGGG